MNTYAQDIQRVRLSLGNTALEPQKDVEAREGALAAGHSQSRRMHLDTGNCRPHLHSDGAYQTQWGGRDPGAVH